MIRFRKILAILIFIYILASAISSYADEEKEELIDIFQSDSKIIAIVEGKNTNIFDLRPKEKVLWRGANGYLGAFLSNLHFFVISNSSSAWQALPLRLDESKKGVASLSPYIALLVTAEGVIGFDAASNRFIEAQLPIHDEVLTAKAEDYVAVVVTSSRAFALAAKNSSFIEFPLRARETVEETKITSSKATVRTSDRLLTFDVEGLTWKEHKF
ncbi:MAG: hypothetical protein ACYTBV_16765 [Planctomycetota bacterium]|jgi:hypothetical protein